LSSFHSGEKTTSESNGHISLAFLLSFNLNATIIILLRALHKNHGTHQLSLVPGRLLVRRTAINRRGFTPSARHADSFAKSAAKSNDTGPRGRSKPHSAALAWHIPLQYADPNLSGLSFELQCAEQEYSINVKEGQP
jgi:hypothetical protein